MSSVRDRISKFNKQSIPQKSDNKEKKQEAKRRVSEVFKKIAFFDVKLDYNLNSASPEFCIQLIKFPHQKYFLKLRKKIRVSDKVWLDEFIKLNGLYELLLCVEKLCKQTTNITNSIRLSISIYCIKEIMNTEHGIDSVLTHCLDNPSYRTIFANGN